MATRHTTVQALLTAACRAPPNRTLHFQPLGVFAWLRASRSIELGIMAAYRAPTSCFGKLATASGKHRANLMYCIVIFADDNCRRAASGFVVNRAEQPFIVIHLLYQRRNTGYQNTAQCREARRRFLQNYLSSQRGSKFCKLAPCHLPASRLGIHRP